MRLHDDLIAAITSWEQSSNGAVAPDTPLISSSRLDSLNLFRLLNWIEEKVGHEIDATAVDVAVDWDTVDAVVAYVEREQARSTSR